MATNTIFAPSDLARLRPLVSAETLAALATIESGDKLPSVFTDANGEEIEFSTSSGIFIEEWANEGGENIYQLGERVFVPYDVGDLNGVVIESDSIKDFFYDNVNYDSFTPEEYLVTFGIAPTLDVAKKGDADSCRVWITHHYAAGNQQAPYDTWAKDDDRNVIEFESYATAQKWIKKAKDSDRIFRSKSDPAGHYNYSHGELAPMDYTICKSWQQPW